MKHLNPGKEFDVIAGKLLDKNAKFILWGAANIGNEIYNVYSKEINIIGVVDKDTSKTGEKLGNVIISTPDTLNPNDDYIVIITTSARTAVSEELEKLGFKKNENYMDCIDFAKIYELYKRDFVISERVDISLTEKCTLKCRKCNMFMPHFKNPKDQTLDAVKRDIDLYFSVVDYVRNMNLLGGEPYLYSSLGEVIEYIGENYRSRIGRLEIFTNATLIPCDDLTKKLGKYDVINRISDYTCVINYKKRFDEFIAVMEKNNLTYNVVNFDKWGDFGFPENPNTLTDEKQLIPFFNTCLAPFRGLYNKKLYFCHLETSAIRAGLYEDNENDYFDLSVEYDDAKKAFFEFDSGYSEKGYVTFCEKCRGCDCVNDLTVPAAEQA